jgi:hypothetical protein
MTKSECLMTNAGSGRGLSRRRRDAERMRRGKLGSEIVVKKAISEEGQLVFVGICGSSTTSLALMGGFAWRRVWKLRVKGRAFDRLMPGKLGAGV